MVVEGEAITRMVVSKMLSTLGVDCDQAVDGESALRALLDAHYDLVLMDCHLPGIDGFEATTSHRAAIGPQTAHDVPIVALVADRRGADIELCLAAGMNGHLSKPVNLKYLTEALDRWLQPLHVA